ncbi:Symplekin tight junction protein C terminal-domain-containing protein [Fomitopsis serialis]|uniref:Symplekin tight junction protein C terminal-domain-containing protein n=1 Tax=Fomitopsis serialis TaxID=139415 RepID=UPI002008E50D|nr:Symplekin tight junction protein C terminal-domain-containing protein [Neoantrodia serialis]KAH9924792.1 Symplekin tight junction protein C terminal-domain-containing protein [Neoantrodia serialis]
MAGNPVDPLQTLSAALAVPADSKEQADLLATLRESLETHPGPIPILCTTLVKTVSGAGDSLLKRWVIDLLHFAICRSSLSIDARTQLASQSVETLASLLHDSNPTTVKVSVQCFATVYPLLFRMLCVNRNSRDLWQVLSQTKVRILEFVWSPTVSNGIKFAAIKFMQRAILVQTRGISDPRLQKQNDPNLAMLPSDHPFMSVTALEAEGVELMKGIFTILYTSNNPDIIVAVINSWASLIKARPALTEVLVSTLAQWTPAKLEGLPAFSIKSVEKTIRILLIHISRTPQGSPLQPQIHSALATQASRMEQAALAEKQRKAAAAAEASRKRSSSATPAQDAPDAKRPKLDHDTAAAAGTAGFDFTGLPTALVTDLVVANIQAFSEATLIGLVQAYRHKRTQGATAAAANVAVASSQVPPDTPGPVEEATAEPPPRKSPTPPPVAVKQEPVDPLKMDIDEEEMEYEPDRLNLELSGGEQETASPEEAALDREMDLTDVLPPTQFRLPPPREFSEDERGALVKGALARISEGAKDLAPMDVDSAAEGVDMWMLLIVRLVTRVTDPAPGVGTPDKAEDGMDVVSEFYAHQDRLRQTLCEYIMADFPRRLPLATTWMNEEWYNDRIQEGRDRSWPPNYETWLNQIVSAYQTHLDGKDRTFSRFLLDLPHVPPDVLHLLRDSCPEADRRQMGFAALREFVTQRPSLRAEAMTILLELTTHPDKITRGAAINTVKRWIPDVQPMDNMIREFALQLLRRLQSRPKRDRSEDVPMNGTHDEHMEDGQLPPEDIIQTPYLPEELELPANNAQILQHLELLFALSTKVPEFLDEIFAAYGGMEETVQETIQQLITPLIRALGSSHGRLLTLLRMFPPGAESLALRVLKIFTEHGRPSAQLVSLVKSLVSERDLDPRFLVPIIAEMDKGDIVRHLPRIVSILNGKPEPKNVVRSVFGSIVQTPPQTFGTVSSNLPRVQQSERLSPAELMVLLHQTEKEIGLKSAIEAIGICFSMTDVFRSEVLGAFMNQIVDEPVLPTLFLRTVIQAVTTYRSLVSFVSTTLLSRLITKKIWTNGPLWEGFIRCAKLIAPASFGALLQLPKDQLRELVDKQPSLKAGLREYVVKKAGNRARTAGYLDIFGEDGDAQAQAQDAPGTAAVATPLASAGGEEPSMQVPVVPQSPVMPT